ncbi:uncharacterized protein lbhl [Syngnathoides biaculeatus]|uniref:uncharacterized protein lbhl n=1 Tax=Syngnathoides biaculeatus TaxID=300417 RepID=UPI002ADDBBD3|nr:uncharacterized protein lbhl [Syngnathoides biaculeatus]
MQTVPTVGEPVFTTVDLCHDAGEDDSYVTANEGGMEELSGQDSNSEDLQRKEKRLPFQIFPDPVEVVLGSETSLNSLAQNHHRERLPSIVVEPTEVSEVESGELRWPPENINMGEDEEDIFLEQCIPPANIADWGEDEEEDEDEEERTSVFLSQQQGLTLIDLQSDAFRDDTPTLPPSCPTALNRNL